MSCDKLLGSVLHCPECGERLTIIKGDPDCAECEKPEQWEALHNEILILEGLVSFWAGEFSRVSSAILVLADRMRNGDYGDIEADPFSLIRAVHRWASELEEMRLLGGHYVTLGLAAKDRS